MSLAFVFCLAVLFVMPQGLFGRAGPKDADLIAGENTVEGDRENDAGPGGGAGPKSGRG